MTRRSASSRELFHRYRDKLRRADESSADEGADRPSDHAVPESSAQKKKPRTRTSWGLIRAFFVLFKGQRADVAFALCTLTIATVLALAPPAATKFVIDNVLGGKPMPEELTRWIALPTDKWRLLMVIVGAVVVISLVRIGFHVWGRWYATRATKRMQLSVRKKVFEHAVRLPLHRIQELKSGGVASVLRQDAGSVADLIFGMLYNPCRAVIQLAGSLVILAWVDWRLLLGAIVLVPLVFITHRTWINRIRPQYRDIRATRERVDGQATESFGGMRVVRAFSRQRTETSRFMGGNNLMARQELFTWWWSRTIEMIWDALIPLASAGLLLYGGSQVLQGALTMGDLMMFLVYLMMLLEPLAVLAQSATQLQNSLAGLDRVMDILEADREMQSAADARPLEKTHVAGAIRFDDVSFRYPEAAAYALRNVTLEVPAGCTVALVGPSGAGKTTLSNLVARFYDPTSGRVLLDGRDLRDIEVENYRSLLGLVEQDVFLFDGTIAQNIGYADRHATDEDVAQAARVANAAEFIDELPHGYDTFIGERGVKLSGGQRQRIAIARALLADPRILILDEATSNLDTESERLIQAGLEHLMRDRTCFVIAHRLSTIAHADLIVVIENGTVVETGAHDELMEAEGRYREMVQLQIAPTHEPAAL